MKTIPALLALSAAVSLLGSSAYAAAAPDIDGIWWANSYSAQIRPMDGGAIPFTPAGAEAFRKNSAGLASGAIVDAARKYCVPDGVPRILATPYPFQIFGTPGFTTIFYEQNHVIRTIPMDRPVASDEALAAYPYFSGNSFGHWEGDTLVVLTKGFNDKTFVDASGVPHSDQLRVTERFRRINGGKQLEDVATIEDPVNFIRPWTARFSYDLHPEIRLDTSFTCGEKHRDLSRVKGIPQ